jgi:NAD(P)-dependent dehydrogenase (short-subunit alcohol dehydrogenase family)
MNASRRDFGGERLNPVALITGAASGIGAAAAARLAEKASGGLILIDVDEDGLEAVADALQNPPERVSTLAFDVSDSERWRAAGVFIGDHYGRLDWAVVSADAAHAGLLTDADLGEWRGITPVNLDGVHLTLKFVAPLLRANAGGGAIVITDSAASLKADPAAASLGASKAGLLQMMRVAARENAGYGVNVNAVTPGGQDMPNWRNLPLFQDMVRDLGSERATFDHLATQTTPMARYTETDDVARLIDMLLTEAGPISGATLVVDSGYPL